MIETVRRGPASFWVIVPSPPLSGVDTMKTPITFLGRYGAARKRYLLELCGNHIFCP